MATTTEERAAKLVLCEFIPKLVDFNQVKPRLFQLPAAAN
jgi:hypothetical protein